jgi:alkylation response protein AidB-like acyl-CoA dehydrogenase
MNFNYSEEQLALQHTLRRFIDREYGFEKRRTLAKSSEGFSREVWAEFANIGILAMPFPEEYDGLGGNAADTMLVMELLGRGLVLEPYLTTVVLAGTLLLDTGSAAQKEKRLPAIARGELLMALAHYEPGTRYELSNVACSANVTNEGCVINGSKTVVLCGNSADELIVSARTSGARCDKAGISLFVVSRNTPGLTMQAYSTQDGGRAAEIRLNNVQVGKDALLGTVDNALAHIERAIDYTIVAMCAEAVGILEALNEVTLDYLKTRKQFGQPIGRFQALQHRMVDMVIATDQARSMTTLAAVKVDTQDAAERRRVVSAAKAYVSQSARSVGQSAIQLHGGMGVVDELIVSHYFKRLTMINATFGDVEHHLGNFSDGLLNEEMAVA